MKDFYHLILMPLLVLTVAACRTTASSSYTDNSIRTDSLQSDSLSYIHHFVGSKSYMYDAVEMDSAGVVVDMTWWSVPDSLGKQYPKKTANVKYQSKSHRGHKARDSLECNDTRTQNLSSKKESSRNMVINEKETEESKPPNYGISNIILALFSLGVLLYVLKKI